MKHYQSKKDTFAQKPVVIRMFQLAALALVMTMSLPAWAGDDRTVKSRVAPIYPDIAKRTRVEGVVNIEATVDPDGKVSSAKATKGNALLAPAAEDAVLKWRFESGPSVSKVSVDVSFVLSH